MKIGLMAVDKTKFPNLALMKLSAWHKAKGDIVEWVEPMYWDYDLVYQSKIFTFSPDVDRDFDCFRDFNNSKQIIPQWQKDMARWAMRRELWASFDFKDFKPRKDFTCRQYFRQ